MQTVDPREMPKEQIPWDASVGSGQEYVVKVGTPQVLMPLEGSWFISQQTSTLFLFVKISLNNSSVRTAEQGWK